MSIPIDHYGDFKLFYDHSLADNSTDEYKHLATVTKEAINRMVMQSDLRDIYHGIQLSTYNPIYEENMGTGKSANREPSDITANLLLQVCFSKLIITNTVNTNKCDDDPIST